MILLLPIFILAQFTTSLNVNLDIPLNLGHTSGQPKDAVERAQDCDDTKYNCARRLPNEATQEEIADAIKRYGAGVKVYAHGDKEWIILGPITRGIPQ